MCEYNTKIFNLSYIHKSNAQIYRKKTRNSSCYAIFIPTIAFLQNGMVCLTWEPLNQIENIFSFQPQS